MRRRRYRLNAWWLIRPYQQYGTGGVVDDEPRGRTQAPRTQTRVVTVARYHQQVDTFSDGADDFALDTSLTMDKLHVLTAETRRRRGEQLRGRLFRNGLELALGFAPEKRPPEQAGRNRVRRLGDIRWRDVKERDARAWGKALGGCVNAPLPRSFDDPEDDPHGNHHPTNRNESQRATVAAISTGGTVMAPRRINSRIGSSSPRWRRTRLQSRVASEPT